MTEITDKWNHYFSAFLSAQKDIYYLEEYVKLYETDIVKALCYVYADDRNRFLMPFLSRPFTYLGKTFYDFETAYGYGGPIANTNDSIFIEKAWKSFFEVANSQNYVAGFVRFHPLLKNSSSFNKIGKLLNDRNTIAINLKESEDDIWMNEIHTKNRNVIKKGTKIGLTFEADYDFKYLDEFINIYNSTMDKLSADSFFYFTDQYYTTLKNNLKQNSFLGIVKYNNEIISSAIFFYNKPWGHYHLAGSKKDYLNLSPNNFLLWEASKELKRHGVELFHLGGGTDSDESNSLFQFKKKFSRSLYQFEIGKVVFNEKIYNDLCLDWETKNPEKKEIYKNHLLKYKY